ncbi:DUF7344 domain-containing protein [Halobacterium yunchengense]|uniref:DUF7344 domain-containing protein n=1 Tax=Halobacterium yunchengense TaxID=3108497 RepID=UPI003AB79AC7
MTAPPGSGPSVAEPTTATPAPRGNGAPEGGLVELHQRHLPMLQDADVVVYDADRGTVAPGEHFREVYSLLRALDSHRSDESADD